MNQPYPIRREEHSQKSSSISNKIEKFRTQIRRKQVENQRRQIRQELLEALSPSKQSLRNIEIHKVLSELMSLNVFNIKEDVPKIEIIVNDLASYSTKIIYNEHLFQIIEFKHIEKLIQLISWENLPHYKEFPRTYIKILTILMVYTIESQEISQQYVELLMTILMNVKSLKGWHENRDKLFYFTQPQLKQIIKLVFSSLKNIELKTPQMMSIFLKPEGIIEISLEQGIKINSYLEKHEVPDNNKETQILATIILFFQQILMYTSEEEIMQKVFEYDFQIIELLLSFLKNNQQNIQIQQAVICSLKTFFYCHLKEKPLIIIKHDLDPFFLKLHQVSSRFFSAQWKVANFQKMLEIEGEKKQSLTVLNEKAKNLESRLIKMFEIVDLIFGINVPNDSESEVKIYDCFQKWFQLYILPIFVEGLSNNQSNIDKVLVCFMNTLKNICLEEVLIQQLLDEMIVVNKLFYYASSNQQSFRLRSNALICLSNIMVVTLDGYSENSQEVLDIFLKNKIIEIFATYIGKYVDTSLNLAMLGALNCLLIKDTSQIKEENRFWIQFCENGGKVRLEKIINFAKPSASQEQNNINFLAESILNQYSGNDL